MCTSNPKLHSNTTINNKKKKMNRREDLTSDFSNLKSMAAALECWSSRASTDEDMVEQVLMRTNDRSEAASDNSSAAAGPASAAAGFKESSAMQKRLQKLSRNVSEAIASFKNSLNIDSERDGPTPPVRIETYRKHVWGSVVRNLTQLYPGSQLPEKLVSNIRKHYDSLPLSQRGSHSTLFEMKKFLEQWRLAWKMQEEDEENNGKIMELSFTNITSSIYISDSGQQMEFS